MGLEQSGISEDTILRRSCDRKLREENLRGHEISEENDSEEGRGDREAPRTQRISDDTILKKVVEIQDEALRGETEKAPREKVGYEERY